MPVCHNSIDKSHIKRGKESNLNFRNWSATGSKIEN